VAVELGELGDCRSVRLARRTKHERHVNAVGIRDHARMAVTKTAERAPALIREAGFDEVAMELGGGDHGVRLLFRPAVRN
jgi:hypothetical protein